MRAQRAIGSALLRRIAREHVRHQRRQHAFTHKPAQDSDPVLPAPRHGEIGAGLPEPTARALRVHRRAQPSGAGADGATTRAIFRRRRRARCIRSAQRSRTGWLKCPCFSVDHACSASPIRRGPACRKGSRRVHVLSAARTCAWVTRHRFPGQSTGTAAAPRPVGPRPAHVRRGMSAAGRSPCYAPRLRCRCHLCSSRPAGAPSRLPDHRRPCQLPRLMKWRPLRRP